MNFIKVCLGYLSKVKTKHKILYQMFSELLDIVVVKDHETVKIIVFPDSITIVDEYGCTRYSEASVYSPEDLYEILDEIILEKSRDYE